MLKYTTGSQNKIKENGFRNKAREELEAMSCSGPIIDDGGCSSALE